MGAMGRFIIFFLLSFISISAYSQDTPAKKHTIELNLFNIINQSIEAQYTYRLLMPVGLRSEAGYHFKAKRLFGSQVENLEAHKIQGFFLKAGPEISAYKGEVKKLHFAVLPLIGAGKVIHEVQFYYPLGVFKHTKQIPYSFYGVSFNVGFTFLNRKDFFFDFAAENTITGIKYDGPLIQGDFPGIGFMYAEGVSIRFNLTFGKRF